jgi:hypothetical protein
VLLNGQTYVKVVGYTPSGAPIGDGAPQVVRGRGYAPQIIFTRPNDTANYGINDVIGSAVSANLELPNAGVAGSLMQILSASVMINRTTLPTGMTGLKLHLWDASPAAIADNAVFAAAAADRAKYRGVISLPTPVVVGGGFCFTFADYVGRPVRLVTSSLWCNLTTDTAVTSPAAETEYTIRLSLAEVGA